MFNRSITKVIFLILPLFLFTILNKTISMDNAKNYTVSEQNIEKQKSENEEKTKNNLLEISFHGETRNSFEILLKLVDCDDQTLEEVFTKLEEHVDKASNIKDITLELSSPNLTNDGLALIFDYLSLCENIEVCNITMEDSCATNEIIALLTNSLEKIKNNLKDLNITIKTEVPSSDEIAESLGLTRGTVVHHLNKLMNAGVVVREKGGYILRENSMQGVIRDMRKDMETMFGELRRAAKEIDQKLGL